MSIFCYADDTQLSMSLKQKQPVEVSQMAVFAAINMTLKT